jgi:hypothetical protein
VCALRLKIYTILLFDCSNVHYSHLVELLLRLPHEFPQLLRVPHLQRLNGPLNDVQVSLSEELVCVPFLLVLWERVGGLKTLEDKSSGLPRVREVNEKIVEGLANAREKKAARRDQGVRAVHLLL